MVGVEGRRVVVGRGGSLALVGLGTRVLGFGGGRCKLVAVCCLAVVIYGSLETLGGSPWVSFMAWDEDTLGFLS